MNSKSKCPVVNRCKGKLNELSSCLDVSIGWIKGHNNSTGNEFADAMAKEGGRNIL